MLSLSRPFNIVGGTPLQAVTYKKGRFTVGALDRSIKACIVRSRS